MERKAASGIMLALLSVGMLTLAFNFQPVRAEPKTWYVDDSGGADFTKIQDAVDAASPGDTIYVYNGTYYENIYVIKSLTLIGDNKYGVIIDGSGYRPIVTMRFVSYVNFTGFTTRNAGRWNTAVDLYSTQSSCISDTIILDSYYGIHSSYSTRDKFSDNIISNTEIGINLDHCDDNTIADNIISNSTWSDPYWGGGIYLYYSNNNAVTGNTVSNTTEVGIWQHHSSYNTIVDNVISQNPDLPMQHSSGVYIGDFSYHNNVLNNDISKSLVGIYVSQIVGDNDIVGNTIANLTSYMCGINVWGPDNKIIGNTITKMGYVGIQLNSVSSDGQYGTPNACTNNLVKGNTILDSTFGINLILAAPSNTIEGNNVSNNILGVLISDQSNDNTVIKNYISNNYYGILLFSSDDTKVYHNNFIDNTQQVLLSNSFNTAWDNGYPSGGNYWSSYADVDLYSGPNQDMPGSDGIWDHPYVIYESNQDRYPLVNPRDNTPPIANAGQDQTVPQDTLVTFDGSGSSDNVGIVSYVWTFIDVTPKTLTGVNPTYTFTTPGVYTVTLNVTDATGNWATDTVTITVLKLTPAELIQRLIETIETWNLPKGTENSLTSKLEDALHLLAIGNENGAIHKLMELMSQVEALRGKKLTDEKADYLIYQAQKTIDRIKE